MAAVTPLSPTVFGFSAPAGPQVATEMEPAGAIESCVFGCSFTGTYVQGQGFSVEFSTITSQIAATRRDNGVYSVVDVAVLAPGREGNLGAFVVPLNVFPTVFGSTTSLTGLLYGPDLATEHAAVAMLGFAAPVLFHVNFVDQLPI